jgi:hypothetical protein
MPTRRNLCDTENREQKRLQASGIVGGVAMDTAHLNRIKCRRAYLACNSKAKQSKAIPTTALEGLQASQLC